MDLRKKLESLGLTLPAVPAAVADYVPAVRSGGHVLVSGQLPLRDGDLIAKGPVPSVSDLEQAQAAARQCVLNALAAADSVVDGDWSGFERVIRLAVYVHSDTGFELQHKVANGGSELLGQVFGDRGRHARAALGAAGLPLGAAVEAELMLAFR